MKQTEQGEATDAGGTGEKRASIKQTGLLACSFQKYKPPLESDLHSGKGKMRGAGLLNKKRDIYPAGFNDCSGWTETVPFCIPDMSFAPRRAGLIMPWQGFLNTQTLLSLPAPCGSLTGTSMLTTKGAGLGLLLCF